MKKEKLVISLIIMVVMICAFAVNTMASSEPQTLTRNSNTSSLTPISNGTSLTPTGNTATGSGETTSLTPSTNNTNTNSSRNAVNNAGSTSYRNLASNTTSDENLPYTGSSYGIVFVIIALVISAVYAYKKVSDYNM